MRKITMLFVFALSLIFKKLHTQKEITQCFFPSRRSRTQESCQGRSQDRPDVRHADLRVGKRQGRGEEAVSLSHGQRIQPPLIISGIVAALRSSHPQPFR